MKETKSSKDWPTTSRKEWFFRVLTLVALTGAGAAWADAQLHVFQANDVLTASDLNNNFQALRATTANGVQYSNMGTFCGLSPAQQGQITYQGLSGYRGAKRLCEVSCGQQTAHLCTTEEVVRHMQMDGTFAGAPDGGGPSGAWYATGIDVFGNIGHMRDCTGFTSTGGESLYWDMVARFSSNVTCATSLPLLCCN